jgi:hypothetical protein
MILNTNQIYNTNQGEGKAITPEVLLYRSIIVRAMMDALDVDIHAWGNTRKQIIQDALSWFSKTNKHFCNICDYANLEPTFIIKKFEQLKKANAKKLFKNKNLNKFLTHYICSFHQEVQY